MVDTPAAVADEIERRRAAALEAEQRYYATVDTEGPGESSTTSAAASAWLWALDALNDFRRTHGYPKPDNPRPRISGQPGLNEDGAEAL